MVETDHVIVAAPADNTPVDLASWFDRRAPVELEIGVGKGGFILRAARADPSRNFLGIEQASKYFRYAADRMARWGVTNVRLLRTDARHFVIHNLRPECLAAVHVYHPDPWPKKRHHKRRLFQRAFVAAVADALAPPGRLYVQTDHAEYCAIIQQLVEGESRLSVIDARTADAYPYPETNFEIKYRRQGRCIYRLIAEKGG